MMKKRDVRNFSPERFARLDTDMWRAYYRHRFLKLFLLLIRLCNQYCSPNYVLTLRAAYHSAMAAIIFRKTKGHENSEKTLKHLTHFYKLLSDHNSYPFDFTKAAELELKWWFIDRYPEKYEMSRAQALAEGAASIFKVSAKDAAPYGQKRAEAMELIGEHHHNPKAIPDWTKIHTLLVEAYQSLYDQTEAIS